MCDAPVLPCHSQADNGMKQNPRGMWPSAGSTLPPRQTCKKCLGQALRGGCSCSRAQHCAGLSAVFQGRTPSTISLMHSPTPPPRVRGTAYGFTGRLCSAACPCPSTEYMLPLTRPPPHRCARALRQPGQPSALAHCISTASPQPRGCPPYCPGTTPVSASCAALPLTLLTARTPPAGL